MSFLAVLLALIVEQLRPLPQGNPVHEALIDWARWTARNFDAGREHHAWVVWAVTVFTPALLTWGCSNCFTTRACCWHWASTC